MAFTQMLCNCASVMARNVKKMDKCWIEDVAFSDIRNPFWIGTTVHDIMIVSIVQLVGTCVCSRRHRFKSWRSLEVFTRSNLIDSAGNYFDT